MELDEWLDEIEETPVESGSKKDSEVIDNSQEEISVGDILKEQGAFDKDDVSDVDDLIGADDSKYKSSSKKVVDFGKIDMTEVPNVIGTGYNPEFIEMVEGVRLAYTRLPKLDEEKIFKEIEKLYVPLKDNTSLTQLSMDIHRVQAARERMAQIVIEVSRCYVFKKRVVNILLSAWGKFTGEKNAEARKGDGYFRLNEFEIDLAATESIYKGCAGMISNLESSHSALSRRVTLAQNQLKIRELGISEEDFFEMEEKDEYSIEDEI